MNSLIRTFNALLGKFAHRNETVKARLDLHKCTEVRQLDDLSFDEVALGILLCLLHPRIRKRILYRERDALCITINALDKDIELLTNLKHLRWMLDAVPCKIRDVSKPIHAADIDERTVVDKALDCTTHNLLRLNCREHSLFLLRAVALEKSAAREDKTTFLNIDLDDLCLNRLVDIDCEILDKVEFHLGCGNEAAQTHDVRDKTALDLFCDLRLDGLALLFNLLDVLPSCHLVCLDLGQATAIVTAEGLDVDIDLIADLHDIACIVRRRNGKIPLRDRNLLLVADIDIRLVAGHLNDFPFDNCTLLDIGHIFLFQKFLHALL